MGTLKVNHLVAAKPGGRGRRENPGERIERQAAGLIEPIGQIGPGGPHPCIGPKMDQQCSRTDGGQRGVRVQAKRYRRAGNAD